MSKMTLEDYADSARKTAIYPNIDNNWLYVILGLCGESGELANKAKKVLRDYNSELNEEMRTKMIEELGDVLWYVANSCFELGISFDQLAMLNLKKLKDRQERNKLHGSGDNR